MHVKRQTLPLVDKLTTENKQDKYTSADRRSGDLSGPTRALALMVEQHESQNYGFEHLTVFGLN